MKGGNTEDKAVTTTPTQRLCNEIQLFDLCNLETCLFKDGKFCTDPELLSAFERIADAEAVRPEVYISEEQEEGDEDYDDEYDDAFDDDDYGDEAEYDDEE